MINITATTTTNLTKLQPKQKRCSGLKTFASKMGYGQGLIPKNIGQGGILKKGPKNNNQHADQQQCLE